MKTLLSLVVCVLALCRATSSELAAAIAIRTVTPNPLLPVSGGAGPSHSATNKQGELTVRALVLGEGDTRVAIVSADFLGFPALLGDQVRASVKGIPPQNILIGVSHTHSAPDCYGFPDEQGKSSADPDYLKSVCRRMTEAIQEAAGRLVPVRLKVATGKAEGRIAYNAYAEALFDPRCHVLQFIDSTSGHPVATLVNYAVHPEVIGSDRGICSPDLIGPFYDRITERGGGIGIFMNSAQGGMVTADNRRGAGTEMNTWDECRRIGFLLADEAVRLVSAAPEQSNPELACLSRPITLPVDSPLMRSLLQRLPGFERAPPDHVVTRLNLLNIGNAQILTVPGEALPNIGFFLKRKMRGQHNLLFGLTNDAFGYILAREDYDSCARYAYITRTSLGERTGPILVEEALALIQSAPQPQELKAK
jgi:hypothetical protein